MSSVIYKITNLVNGKIYVGQTIRDRSCYLGSGIEIKKDIKKYGKKKFKKEILEYCKKQNQLNERERYWIKKCKSKHPMGYNLTDGGNGAFGHKMSDAQRKFLSDRNKNSYLNPKNNPMYGKRHTEETKKKISEKAKERFKNKENHPMYGKLGVWLGKHHSDKIKKLLYLKNRGRKHTEEAKKKISEKAKGRVLSEETRQKLRIINIGKKVSKKTRQKLRDIQLKRWKKQKEYSNG